MQTAAWFKKGLRFGCTACGKCCRSPRTQVFLNENEMKAIATSLDLHLTEFVRQYTVEQENDKGQLLTTLKNKDGAGCALLGSDKKTCTVYQARPTQCRTYPFWSQNMIGEAEWRAEASRCEGIDLSTGKPVRTAASSAVPVVAPETIVHQMILSQVHARGAGPNWTYDEATELLPCTPENTTTFDSFISEFSAKNFSKVVFESASLRVVDVTAVGPLRVDDDDDDADDDFDFDEEHDEKADAGVESHATASTIRHLEFVRSSQLAQTEMLMLPSPSDKVDHGQLIMPVHRLLATVGLNVDDQSAATRVAVLGAGGCALPSYLVHSRARRGLQVSAVEPDQEVLAAASQFFGAKLRYDHWRTPAGAETKNSLSADSDDIAAFVTDGASFLREASSKGLAFDALLMDAFEMADDGDSDDAAAESRAPPRSLLDVSLLLSCLAPKGVLAINMYGPPAWFDEVQQALCPPLAVGVSALDGDGKAGTEGRRFGKPIILEFRNAAAATATTGSRLGADGAGHPRNAVLLAAAEEDTDDLFQLAMNVFKFSQGAGGGADGAVKGEGSAANADGDDADDDDGEGSGEDDGWVTTLTYADIASLSIRD